jgi:hypothetical protein
MFIFRSRNCKTLLKQFMTHAPALSAHPTLYAYHSRRMLSEIYALMPPIVLLSEQKKNYSLPKQTERNQQK